MTDRRSGQTVLQKCGTTIRSAGHIARLQRISANDAEYVTPGDMLSELCEDEKARYRGCALCTHSATMPAMHQQIVDLAWIETRQWKIEV